MGSKLAMVTSQAEQQALASKISQDVWIGLHRDPNDHSRWMWVDGSRATYTHWRNREPMIMEEMRIARTCFPLLENGMMCHVPKVVNTFVKPRVGETTIVCLMLTFKVPGLD